MTSSIIHENAKKSKRKPRKSILLRRRFSPNTRLCALHSRRPPSGISTSAPHLCLLLLEKWDRSAVDEECALSPADFSSKIQHLFSPVGVGAPTTRTLPFPPTPSGISTFAPHLCLLLLEKGDRGAVDEEECVILQQNLDRGKKRLIRQPSAATFSHRRRHICIPPVPAFSHCACSAQALIPTKSRKTKSAPPNPRFGGAP